MPNWELARRGAMLASSRRAKDRFASSESVLYELAKVFRAKLIHAGFIDSAGCWASGSDIQWEQLGDYERECFTEGLQVVISGNEPLVRTYLRLHSRELKEETR